jgi:hypothetical protein
MSVSEWAVASSVLTYFQTSWVNVRPTVMAQLPPAMRTSLESVVPRSLTPDGTWGPRTRDAARAVTVLVFGAATYNVISTSFPGTAAGIGTWFMATLEPYDTTLPEDALEVLDSFVDETDDGPSYVTENMEGRTMEVVEGISVGMPVVRAGSAPAREVIAETDSATAIFDAVASGGTSSGASILEPSRDPAAPITLDTMLITGERSTSVWTYALWALGALTFGGLAWWAWGYRTRRRSTA